MKSMEITLKNEDRNYELSPAIQNNVRCVTFGCKFPGPFPS